MPNTIKPSRRPTTRAQAEYTRLRPDIEADKARRAAVERDRNAFFRRLGVKKGMPLDAKDVEDGARLGINLDPNEWVNAKVNFAIATMTDPTDPT